MSTTLTAPAGASALRAEMRRRAAETIDFDGEELQNAMYELQSRMGLDAYWVGPDSSDLTDIDWIEKEWMDRVVAAAKHAWREAITAAVIPAMVDAVVDLLPSAPHDLVTYPESDKLRADLALLEGMS